MIFQALSIVSPSGDRIRSGTKTIEVRRWHPGELPLRDLLIIQNDTFLTDESPFDPKGRAVALVDVLFIRDWQVEDLERSCAVIFAPGWLAWELSHVRPVNYPLVLPAKRRIYPLELDRDLLRF